MKNSEKGFSLTELAIGVGLIGGLALLGMKVIENSNKAQKNSVTRSDLRSIRGAILSTLQHPASFKQTLENFSNKDTFACLKLKGDKEDCRTTSGEFKLFRMTIRNQLIENRYISFSSNSLGFNQSGVPCNEFNFQPGKGSDRCPFKYVATWSAICPDISKIQGGNSVENKCRNPLFNVHVKLLFNPADVKKFPIINTAKQDVKIVLAQAGSDQQSLCRLTGNGYFDSVTNSCILLRIGDLNCVTSCPPGSNAFAKGFFKDGSLNCSCSPVISLRCPNNQVVLGVNDDGTLNCGNGLIAGLEYSGSIKNTSETYVAHLKKNLDDATLVTNTARISQTQASNKVISAQIDYNKAEAIAKAAQDNVDQAKAAAGAIPTGAQLAALDQSIAAYNKSMKELQIAEAELTKAKDVLLIAEAAEAGAKKSLEDFLAKLL